MNTFRTNLSLALLVAFAASANPASAGTTRAQVRAELGQALITGDVMAPGDSGLKLNELYPQRYRKPDLASPTTRAEVKAEFASSRRVGELIPAGEGANSLREEFPQRYPPVAVAASKTRTEVRAETLEAIRNGDVIGAGETDLTLGARYPQRFAAERGPHRHIMAVALITNRRSE